MQKEMDMRVDEAGEQRGVAEVDEADSLRMLDRRADSTDALALDEDLAGLEQGSGVDLQKAGGVEHDGRGGWLLGVGGKRQGHGAGGQSEVTQSKI